MILRRTLLAGASAFYPAALVPGGAIDTHTHFYDPGRPQGVPWPPPSDALLYRATLPQHFAGVTRDLSVAGTIVVEASPWLEDNQWILDLARDNPVIRGFVGNLDIEDPAFPRNLARFAKNPLFRGIRIGAKTVRSVAETGRGMDQLRRLAGSGLSLDILGDAAALASAGTIAAGIPDLRVILDHLPFDGGTPEDLKPVQDLPNVFAKVSNVPRRINGIVEESPAYYYPVLDTLRNRFGPTRLIYGSNWPVSNRVAPYSVAWRIVKSYFDSQGAPAADDFFHGNSRKAYRWLER